MQLDTIQQTTDSLITAWGATLRDLMDYGLTEHKARKALANTAIPSLPSSSVTTVPHITGFTDTVCLVPMGEVGRRYLSHNVYLRDYALKGQIRLRSTHLGYSDDGFIKTVRPILRRIRLGSGGAIAGAGVVNSAAIQLEPDFGTSWPEACTLVELGPPIPVGLPLGFRPNPNGGATAIAGVRHVELDALFAAVQAGGALTDVPSI